MLELAVRFRCNHCGTALEKMFNLKGWEFPFTTPQIELKSLPPEWARGSALTNDADAIYCLQHDPNARRLQLVRDITLVKRKPH